MTTILILSVLILLHELGHFLTAKKFGVRVDEFGLGLPPKALKLFRRGDTEYTLNWLPLGGFVRLFGEDGDLNLYEKLNPLVKQRSFVGKPAWQRGLILLAGIFMNLLLGLFIFSAIYSFSGVPRVDRNMTVVTQVVKDSPAEGAGLEEGDVVIKIGDQEITEADAFVESINDSKGKAITLQVAPIRPDGTVGDSSRQVTVIPRENPPAGEGAIGVGIATVPLVSYEKKPWFSAPYYGAIEGVKESYAWGRETIRGIAGLAGSLGKGTLPEGISGPVGVWRAGEKISESSGWLGSLRFGAILSINLAIFNLLPFPGLDGGRLLFLGLERIFGRQRVNRYENQIHTAGVILLILLLITVTWRDIWG